MSDLPNNQNKMLEISIQQMKSNKRFINTRSQITHIDYMWVLEQLFFFELFLMLYNINAAVPALQYLEKHLGTLHLNKHLSRSRFISHVFRSRFF